MPMLLFSKLFPTTLSLTATQIVNSWTHLVIFFLSFLDKRAVYLGCFKQENPYIAVRAGTKEGAQYMYTQVQ